MLRLQLAERAYQLRPRVENRSTIQQSRSDDPALQKVQPHSEDPRLRALHSYLPVNPGFLDLNN
jgi:hypothetical protein